MDIQISFVNAALSKYDTGHHKRTSHSLRTNAEQIIPDTEAPRGNMKVISMT